MSKDIELSVIMPVFNEEECLAAALESVLWQRVNFPFEILIVDDASTDGTCDVVQEFVARFPNIITLLRNDVNMGKGYGFMRAYAAARGKYFHVLDGDDYFLNFNKLQIQKDFLDQHSDFFAVCHNSFRVFSDGTIGLERIKKTEEVFDYEACIGRKFYAHTSTYMFRKVGNTLPDYFKKRAMRGDDACFIYHAFQSKGKVKYLPMIGSVYNFHEQGIWTSLSSLKRMHLQVDFFNAVLEDVIGDPRYYEYKLLENGKNWVRKNADKPVVDQRKRVTRDHILTYCQKVAGAVYQPNVRKNIFDGMHAMQIVDSLCEGVGGILFNNLALRSAQRPFNEKCVAITAVGSAMGGGRVAEEIKKLASIYVKAGWDVHVLFTSAVKDSTEEVENYLQCDGKLSFWYLPEDGDSLSDKVAVLQEELYHLAPQRLYPFISYTDVIQVAALQRGLAAEVIVNYIYDHGTSLGIHHSAIDCVIARTPPQARALAQRLGEDRVLFIPPLLEKKGGKNRYEPPADNERINTACAIENGYRIESKYNYNYAHVICHLLKLTGGTHYHYGSLSDGFLNSLIRNMVENDLSADRFVHMEWADDLSGDLLARGVHLFVAPFPTCPAQIVIEVMSAGIPLLNHIAPDSQLPQSYECSGEDQPVWYNYFDLSNILISLDSKKLSFLSKKIRRHYETYYKYKTCVQRFLNKEGYLYPEETRANVKLQDVDELGYYKYNESLFVLAKKENALGIKAHERPADKVNKTIYTAEDWGNPENEGRRFYFFYKRRLYLILLLVVSLLYLLPGIHYLLAKKYTIQKVVQKIKKYWR